MLLKCKEKILMYFLKTKSINKKHTLVNSCNLANFKYKNYNVMHFSKRQPVSFYYELKQVINIVEVSIIL